MDSVISLPSEVAYKFLALEGGGAKGYVYVGVAQELERLGLLSQVEEIAGSSVGAITDLYLASGYTVDQIKQKIFNLDFKNLLLDDHYVKVPFNWANKFGFFDADLMHQKFRDIIKEVTGHENTTFEQWHQLKIAHPEKKLKDIIVEACNISTGYNETFSHTTEHKDVPIADAVRASMAFPLVFTPMKIKGNLYNDGGMQNNCPMSVFGNPSGVLKEGTLGICLEDLVNIHYFLEGKKPRVKTINNAIECLESQIEAMLNVQSYYLMTGPYKDKIIYCDTLDAGTLDFALSPEKKEALAASGQYGVMRFIMLNHPEIAKKYYPEETLRLLQGAQYPLSITEFLDYVKKQTTINQIIPKSSDAPHIHWLAMPILHTQGGCGNRRTLEPVKTPVQLVTPSFNRMKQNAGTLTPQAANDSIDLSSTDKNKKNDRWCSIM